MSTKYGTSFESHVNLSKPLLLEALIQTLSEVENQFRLAGILDAKVKYASSGGDYVSLTIESDGGES